MPRMVALSVGSSARKASRSNWGMEKGLWEKSIFLSSSFHSYMGKSTIQQNLYSSCGIRFSSRPRRVRAWPAMLAARSVLASAAKNSASPAFTFAASAIAVSAAGGMNLAMGPLPVSVPFSSSNWI